MRQLRVEAPSEADGHGEARRCRARCPITHSHSDRAVGDPEARDSQLVDGRHVPFHPDLLCEGIEVLTGLGGLRTHPVDVDGLHRAVELGDLLLQCHLGDESLSALSRLHTGRLPGTGCFAHGVLHVPGEVRSASGS